MKKEFNLSEKKKFYYNYVDEQQVVFSEYAYPEKDVKEKIQNAQMRLKEGFVLKEECNFVDEIFKEEFGGELI